VLSTSILVALKEGYLSPMLVSEAVVRLFVGFSFIENKRATLRLIFILVFEKVHGWVVEAVPGSRLGASSPVVHVGTTYVH